MPDRITSQLIVACIFFVLYRVVSGSCTQWGQSCWGGLGKRSEGSTDWFLARLLSAQKSPSQIDDRNLFGSDNIVRSPRTMNQFSGEPTIPRLETPDGISTLAQWRSANDEVNQEAWAKMRLYQLLSG